MLIGVGGAGVGCSNAARRGPTEGPDSDPAATLPGDSESEARIDAVAGRPIVIAMAGMRVGEPAAFVSGEPIPTSWARIAPARGAQSPAASGWLPRVPEWRAIEVGARDRVTDNVVAVLELQPRGSERRIRFAGRTWSINWLPDPRREPERLNLPGQPSTRDPLAWRPVITPAAVRSPTFQSFLRAEARSPVTRWRVKLLLDGLEPAAAKSAAVPVFEDPVLEAMATHLEDRWRAALIRVGSVDPQVRRRLIRRLCAAVDFGGGLIVPAWEPDTRRLDDLLTDLLSPSRQGSAITRLALEWVEAQPVAAAWIVDDAGTIDASTNRASPVIGLANMSDDAVPTWVAAGVRDDSPDMTSLAPWSARIVTVGGVERGPLELRAHVGDWVQTLKPQMTPARWTPPGLLLGPGIGDRDASSWLAGRESELGRGVGPAVWLFRASTPTGTASPRLFVELPASSSAAPAGLRVHFGASTKPTSVITIRTDGAITDELDPARSGMPVEVTRDGDRVAISLELPAGLVDARGVLRVGWVWTGSDGRRASWPRPMFPWDQRLDARVAIDTSAWGEPVEPTGEPR